MKRLLFNLLAGLSLLLCVATVVLWKRSYSTMESGWSTSRIVGVDHFAAILSNDGTIVACRLHSDGTGAYGTFYGKNDLNTITLLVVTALFMGGNEHHGFGFKVDREKGGVIAEMPDWVTTVAFSALPAFWCWRKWRKHRRRSCSLCSLCGYDLRATPDRCPECGSVPKPATNSN